jgi:hypothetical protein
VPNNTTPQAPVTQQEAVQFRGPNTSDNYNQRIQDNYTDLTILYNRVNLAEQQNIEAFSRFYKDQLNMQQALLDLESRITSLEKQGHILKFSNFNQIDTTRFDNTSYAVATGSQLSQDSLHGQLTLPQIPAATVSKLAFTDPQTGVITLPSSLTTSVIGINGSADNVSTATISTSPPELAVARQVGRIWQRNVICTAPNGVGAQMAIYIRAPQEIFTTANANTLILHPFPALGTDILEIAYSTNIAPIMDDSDGYKAFPQMHVDDTNAVGWVPPGTFGDGSDTDLNAGFRAYYFDPVPITALRIKLGQRAYYQENGNYVYSYGASLIDLLYTKFLSAGSCILRFDAPQGQTISNVTSVQPYLFNVIEEEIPNVFSYQVIWETGYNSGIYTTNPVPFSQRVWVQVNLTTTANGGTPALSGLSLNYS